MGLICKFLKTYTFLYHTFVASLVIGLKIIEVQASISTFFESVVVQVDGYQTRLTFKKSAELCSLIVRMHLGLSGRRDKSFKRISF